MGDLINLRANVFKSMELSNLRSLLLESFSNSCMLESDGQAQSEHSKTIPRLKRGIFFNGGS